MSFARSASPPGRTFYFDLGTVLGFRRGRNDSAALGQSLAEMASVEGPDGERATEWPAARIRAAAMLITLMFPALNSNARGLPRSSTKP